MLAVLQKNGKYLIGTFPITPKTKVKAIQEGTAVNIEGKWRKVSDTQYFYIKYKGLEVDVVANDYIPIIGTNIPQFFNPHARLEVVDLNGVKQVLHLQDINWQDVVYWKFF